MIEDSFKKVQRSVEKAFGKARERAGYETDADLAFYKNLTPGDLEFIRRKYGDAALAEYKQEMEGRKSRGGK